MALKPEELQEKVRAVLNEVNPGAIIEENLFRDEVTFYVDKRWIVALIRALKTHPELSFNMLSDITAVDYLNMDREPRFDVIYNLYSLANGNTVRLKAPVAEDHCRIDSICELWTGANFLEREVYDMFGVIFNNHPNLERLLMPENWKGHPLRKDFPIGGAKSFYYKHDTFEYAGEPDDLVPRIRIQEGDV